MEKDQKHIRSHKSANNSVQQSGDEDNTKVTNSENQTAIYGRHDSSSISNGKPGTNARHSNIQQIEYTDGEIID